MNKELAHFFWEGKISNLELAAVRSFIEHGFEVYIWSYNGLQIDGAISKDAGEILPKDYIDKLEVDSSVTVFPVTGRISILSDLLRLEIVNKFNGWWFDTDCFCLKDQSEFKKLRKDLKFYATAVEIRDGKPEIPASVFYAEGDYADELLAQGRSVIASGRTIAWLDSTRLFTNFAEQKHLTEKMGGVDTVFAISWREMELLIDPKLMSAGLRKIKKSHVAHVYNAQLTDIYQIDKNNPPSGSLLHYLCNCNK